MPQSGQSHVAGASGFFLPQFGQKLKLMFFMPQSGQSHPLFASGFFVPQSGQKLNVMPVLPQFGQIHPDSGAGFGLPQFGQNLNVMPFVPHVQSQPSAGAAGCAVVFAPCGCIFPNMLPICGAIVLAAAMPTPRPSISPTMLEPPPAEIAGPILPMPSAYAFCTSACKTSF